MSLKVKVCGMTDAALVERAAGLGAAFVGFIFFPPSPRYIEPAKAAELAAVVPSSMRTKTPQYWVGT